MPLGSSSEAPVIRPGPSRAQRPRPGGLRGVRWIAMRAARVRRVGWLYLARIEGLRLLRQRSTMKQQHPADFRCVVGDTMMKPAGSEGALRVQAILGAGYRVLEFE